MTTVTKPKAQPKKKAPPKPKQSVSAAASGTFSAPGAEQDPVEVLAWALTAAGYKTEQVEPYEEADEDWGDPEVAASSGPGPDPDPSQAHALNQISGDAELALHQKLLRDHLAYFLQTALVGPSEFDGQVLVPEHHMEWAELIEDHRRVCILAPRDHGKSFVCSVAYSIWRAVTNPGSQVFVFSKTQDQAQRILQEIKDQIEDSPHLQGWIPKGVRGWNAKRVILANGSRIFARGFGTRVRGAHPDFVVCDDPLNDESGWSKTQRERQVAYFFSAISNLVRPHGQIVVVGTPFHELDLYGEIRRRGAYHFKKYSALNEILEGGKPKLVPLWHERYSLEYLLFKRQEIGEILFAREFQCNAISDDISLFPHDLLNSAHTGGYQLGMPRQWWIDRGCTLWVGVDVATGATASSDYFVIVVLATDQNGHRWLVEVYRHNKLSFAQMRAALSKIVNYYMPESVFVESVAAQDLLRQAAKDDLPVRVVAFHTNADKHRFQSGLPSLRVLYEQGRIHTPVVDERSEQVTKMLDEELHGFTIQDGKVVSVTEHDDMGMALWLAEQAARYGVQHWFMTSGSEKVTKAAPLMPHEPMTPPTGVPQLPAVPVVAPPVVPNLSGPIAQAPLAAPNLVDPSTGQTFHHGNQHTALLQPQHLGLGLGAQHVQAWWSMTPG